MISGYRLAVRPLRDGRLAMAVPPWFRALLLASGLLVAYFLVATSPGGLGGVFVAANTVPLLLAAASILGAAYDERWTFDRAADRFTYEAGLLLFRRRRSWPLSGLREVELGVFIRGRPHAPAQTRPSIFARPVLTLNLRDREGELHRIELYSHSQSSRARTYAAAIAAYCGLPLTDSTAAEGSA